MYVGTFLLSALLVVGVHGIFDCSRDPNLCPAGQPCDYTTRHCTCDGTHEGPRCDIVTALKDQGGCSPTNPCVTGTCYDDGAGNPLCSCPDDYIGATCADRRYDANCDYTGNAHTSISITADIASGTAFVGRAYIDGQAGTAACELTCTGAGVCTMASIAFGDATCGATTDDATSRARLIVLEYASGLTTSARDLLITIKCGLGDTVDKTASITTTYNNANLGQTEVDLSAGDADVSFTAAPAANALGDTVTVTADLTAAGKITFKQILVKACSVSNGGVTHTVIQDYCLVESYLAADVTAPARTGTTHTWTFEAIRINDQDNLDVTCTIRVCVVEADCAAVAGCPRGDAGFGRKKRDVENAPSNSDTVVEKELKTRIRVLERIAEQNAVQKQTAPCYMNWQTTATIIALAVSLLVLLIVCMVLVIKTVLRRKNDLYRSEESSSTATLPHLPAYK